MYKRQGVKLSLSVPGPQWSAVVSGSTAQLKMFDDPVAPGATVSADFKVTSGPAAYNGDLVAHLSWTGPKGKTHSESAVEKVRNVSPCLLYTSASLRLV